MASGVFAKLKLKDQREIVVLDAPAFFETELRMLEGVHVRRILLPERGVDFARAFATRRAEVEELARSLAKLPAGDPMVWVAYPKGTSKQYTCDFNRDTGWEPLGRLGFVAVSGIAIDDDWSALRFRRVEFIKSLKRAAARARSAAGKRRVQRRARGSRSTTR